MSVIGIDHIAITAQDIDATCDFYVDLFGARRTAHFQVAGKIMVQQLQIGGAVLSIHRKGNSLELVASHPAAGGADVCFRWGDSIDTALALLAGKEVQILDGPSPRISADGKESLCVFFRKPDGNLVELMSSILRDGRSSRAETPATSAQ